MAESTISPSVCAAHSRITRKPNTGAWSWDRKAGREYGSFLAGRLSGVLKANRIIDRMAKLLFGPEIPFGGLDRSVTQEELNLFQLATGQVAELRARVPQVVRREVLNSGACSRGLYNLPNRLRSEYQPMSSSIAWP